MYNQINFAPTPTQLFKIASCKDADKVLTIQPNTNHIIIQNYTGSPTQHFHIYKNNMYANRFALVSDEKAVKI